MIKYFSAVVLLLTIDAAPVADMQSMIRRQSQPNTHTHTHEKHAQQSLTIDARGDVVTKQPTAPEIQVFQINDQSDSSLMQNGDGGDDGDCSTDKVFDEKDGGTKQWKGSCKSLVQCQEECTGDCTGFNWWPPGGGCRTNTGAYDETAVTWTTVGGDATCTPPATTPTTPECDNCPSLTGDACRVMPCSTNKAFKKKGSGTQQWQGKCKTLAECQALCTGDCTRFTWWPEKGGCRTNTGKYREVTVGYTAIGGSKSCSYSGGPTSPTDLAECP